MLVLPPSSDQRPCLLVFQEFLQRSKETAGRMTAVENKEEISDTDSGIILHCGESFAAITPWRPISPQTTRNTQQVTAVKLNLGKHVT